MLSVWTSRQLADDLGADRRRITKIAQRRRWARVDDVWLFTDEQADEIRRTVRGYDEHVPMTGTPCSVEGCGQAARFKGMCNAHYRRVSRHGSTESRVGAHQREKDRCPNGHEYTPENTYRFADGRRRCRTCRLERAQLAKGDFSS